MLCRRLQLRQKLLRTLDSMRTRVVVPEECLGSREGEHESVSPETRAATVVDAATHQAPGRHGVRDVAVDGGCDEANDEEKKSEEGCDAAEAEEEERLRAAWKEEASAWVAKSTRSWKYRLTQVFEDKDLQKAVEEHVTCQSLFFRLRCVCAIGCFELLRMGLVDLVINEPSVARNTAVWVRLVLIMFFAVFAIVSFSKRIAPRRLIRILHRVMTAGLILVVTAHALVSMQPELKQPAYFSPKAHAMAAMYCAGMSLKLISCLFWFRSSTCLLEFAVLEGKVARIEREQEPIKIVELISQ